VQTHLAAPPSVASHLARAGAEVAATYHCLLAVARGLGPVTEDAKKTSIHLVRRTAFAGVATRRKALLLTVKSQSDIHSPRIVRSEQTSANRWHLELRLERPSQVDEELVGWLEAAYHLA
jgi:hypothetical protein